MAKQLLTSVILKVAKNNVVARRRRGYDICTRLLSGVRSTTSDQKRRRDQHREIFFPQENRECIDEMEEARRTIDTLFEGHEIELFGRKIEKMPYYPEEVLSEQETLPTGLNPDWAQDYLRASYEELCGCPHLAEMMLKRPDYEPVDNYLLGRIGTNYPAKVEWYSGGQAPGTVYHQRIHGPYAGWVRHSFSNQEYKAEQLWRGTTHVAVGFVDLGILFESSLKDNLEDQDGPLRFLGVDSSAYAVAKTKVIWEMLKQTPEDAGRKRKQHLRSIVQVWFSATWTKDTENAVKRALAAICSESPEASSPVYELLHYWLNAGPMSLLEARKQVAGLVNPKASEIGNLLRSNDRVAMAKYEMTRDFAVGNFAHYGNTLMFDCPDGTSPLENDETVFSAFNWREVMEILRTSNDSSMTIIDAADKYAYDKVSKIAKWAASGEVVVELKHSSFQDAVDYIADQRPRSMSWSNICDYLDYSDFHRLARECSKHGDTIHFGYSMNWIIEVFGVSILDYLGPDKAQLRRALIEDSSKAVAGYYQMSGWESYLRTPPPTSPINTACTYGLRFRYFREWSNSFFGAAGDHSPCHVGSVECVPVSPLTRSGHFTVGFKWTYDPDVSFGTEDESK